MKLVKLPMFLGLKVADILKNKGIPLRKNNTELLSLEFTEEELGYVKKLELINPVDGLEGIEHLQNLEVLRISTKGGTAFKNVSVSISDKDINRISKLDKLKSLTIDNQRDISWVYLDNLQKLEELVITRNPRIQEISGLNNLKQLDSLSVYGNSNLYCVDDIEDLISSGNLMTLELDLLNFPEVVSLKSQLMKIVNCSFIEVLASKVEGKDFVSYTYAQANFFHEKCLEISDIAVRNCHDIYSKIVYIEKYLAENVKYDYDGSKAESRSYIKNGVQRGKSGGTNSAYNGIMFGYCVCEGYTRAMQYLLKIMGIKTKNVHCISGANKIKIKTNYHNQVELPDDGYHSIIRIDDGSMLYCDACWDAGCWRHGDETLPYCLLTKEEISRDHTLSFEEDEVSNDHLKIPREKIARIMERISSIENDDSNENKIHTHR